MIMDKIYYLFSKENRHEAIYMCDEKNYIENPTLQTGVYPMGMLLSCVIKVLTPWYQQDLLPSIAEKKLSEGYDKLLSGEFSFSSHAKDDTVFHTALNLLLVDYKQFSPIRETEQCRKLLKSYMNYIFLCQDNQKLASIDNIRLLISQNGNILPKQTLHISGSTEEKHILFEEQITDLLSNSVSSESFMPSSKELPRAFKNLGSIETKKTKWSALATPIYVYEIYNILDFILASLHCIFEQEYFLGKCLYCGDLIITNDRKRKYCPNDDNDIGCAVKIDRERRRAREKASKSRKIHHSIRSQLSSRIGAIPRGEETKIRTKESNDFIKKTAEMREKPDFNDEEYIAWMKEYWENVKEEGKIRRAAKKNKY